MLFVLFIQNYKNDFKSHIKKKKSQLAILLSVKSSILR